MGVRRIFLGWDGAPPLERACAWLTAQRGGFDLSDVLVVVPGARIGRLLTGLLIDGAERAKQALAPPTVCTPGELAGAIVRPEGRPAQAVHRRLAWMRAISAAGALPALLPRTGSDASWQQGIGSLLDTVHRELAGEGLRFDDVPPRTGNLDDREIERWHEAGRLQRAYREELAAAGLVDESLAVLDALDAGRAAQVGRVVLLGLPDLNEVGRRAVESAGVDCTALIFAPESEAGAFDGVGRVRVEAWMSRPVPLGDEQIVFAEDAADQARRFAEALARLGGAYSVHDITVGVPDEGVTPHLVRAAERYAGVAARPAAGTPITSSTIFQLIESMQRFLEEDTFEAMGRLVRQPDMERYLLRSFQQDRVERWLQVMDRYAADHLPGRGALSSPIRSTRAEMRDPLERLQRALRALLEPLRSPRPGASALLGVMRRVFAGASVGRLDPNGQDTVRAIKTIAAAAGQRGELPESWRPATGAELLRLVLDACRSERLPPERSAQALELLGWLEVPLDPAPVAIVTGVNDSFLPETFGADPLLPDSLRSRLGMACADRRLARDVFLMTVLARSREHVRLICGRKGADGSPLTPSRLLFAADDEAVVRRVGRFCDARGAARPIIRARRAAGGRSLFEWLPYVEGPAVETMAVTAFRTYIRSPYLFYLQHVMRLREHEEAEAELSPRVFGDVVHIVLRRFGESEVRDSTSARTIHEWLSGALAQEAERRFGASPPVAIAVQLEMARLRLEEFAAWQADRRESGWSIRAVEWSPREERVHLPGMEGAFWIRGTIDRVEVHDSGEAAIVDYKTGDTPVAPRQAHFRSGQWVDLQLPLYRHLAGELNLPRDPALLRLGYIVLPRTPGKVGLLSADWTEEELSAADDRARDIAERVRNREFRRLGPEPAEEGTFAALSGTALSSTSGRKESGARGAEA